MIESEVKQVYGEKLALGRYLDKYYSLIDGYLKSQIEEEDFKGKSTKQYEYAIISYVHRFVSILSHLSNFTDYTLLYNKYNLDSVKKVLMRKGINLNTILDMYNLLIIDNDDKSIQAFKINQSSISETHDAIFITSANNIVEDVDIPLVDPFNIYTGVMSEYDLDSDNVTEIKVFEVIGLNDIISLDFNAFEDEYPVVIVPTGLTISAIREVSTNINITEGFTISNITVSPDGINIYDVYVFRDATLSNELEPFVINLEYNAL